MYEVVAPIGAGGMGEVYRARDTRLERSVAIKVLPAEFAADASLKLRFEREARTISALSHPNICSLFDVGETGDRAFLVMEYLEGESLADRLSKGPLPIDQVLKLGVEIASALDTAHRQGIIHRDIKPGNIMLTKSGAKLLDFGLARVSAPDILAGPTEVKPITEQGTILGTYQYMAPEQVEGRTADARTDVFALGAVLYEAATGQRAFDGKSRASLIAAILDHEPPPIPTVRPLAPMSLDRVVRACLRKDPNDRVQTAHDLMLQLTWIRESTSTGEGTVAVKPRRRINWIAAVLAVTTIIFAALYARTRMVRPQPVTFSILPASGTGTGESVAISPDGKSIAYTGGREGEEDGLWIRSFADPQPRAIAGTSPAAWPFWSPDGKSVGIFSFGKLKRVDLATGSVHTITAGHYGVGATWKRDGTIVFAKRFNDALYRVRAAGGDAVPVTKLDPSKRETVHGWPHFLDDGEHFVFVIRTVAEERNQIAVASLRDGTPKKLVEADSLLGASQEHLLYVRDNILYAHRLDDDALELRGDPVEIARDVAYGENWASSGASVSPAGAIAYFPATVPRSDIREYDRRGSVLRTLMSEEGLHEPQMSPDGKRIVVSIFNVKKGAADIWIVDPFRSVRTRLTSGLANHRDPTWSADGSKILFGSDGAGMYDLYVQSADDAAPAQVLWKSNRDKQNAHWMPDGRIVVTVDEEHGNDLFLIRDGKPQALLSTDLPEDHPAVSPDGKWVAFSSRRGTPLDDIFVMPLSGGRVTQISSKGGFYPAWSRDGSEIFFVAPDRTLMSVAFRGGDPGPAQTLFTIPRGPGSRPFTVTPSGTFLASTYNLTEAMPDHIDVMLNWQAKLQD